MDEETPWEVVVCVQKISEAFLCPVLEEMLCQFPFVIKGFHTDNGSEFINRPVAELLDKLQARFTKSRPRQSNDPPAADPGRVQERVGGEKEPRLRPYPSRPGVAAQRLPPGVPQPVH